MLPRVTEYSRELIAEIDRRFGAALKAQRERRHMSQANLLLELQLSHGIKWHQSTVTKVEAGIRPVRLQEAAAIASILGMNLDDFILIGADNREVSRREVSKLEARLLELHAVGTDLHRVVDQRRRFLEDGLGRMRGGGVDGEHPAQA
jgi:transcriptional regulator with XRE-family HTH domain